MYIRDYEMHQQKSILFADGAAVGDGDGGRPRLRTGLQARQRRVSLFISADSIAKSSKLKKKTF